MVDVKKLITGFLIVGSAAVGSGLILAANGGWFSSTGTPAAQNITVTGIAGNAADISGIQPGTPLAAGGGAFVQQEAQPGAPALTSGVIPPLLQASDTNNLTDRLATAFVNGVILANPTGAIQDDSGNPMLTSPDAEAIAASVASTTMASNLQTPDWDIEAASQPIKTINSAASSAIATYNNALSNIVNTDIIATNLGSIVDNQNPDPTQVSFVQSNIQKALSDSLALVTPTPLVAFQKSWVKMLVYQKNYLVLLANANNDPVKTELLVQNESDQYNAAIQEFQIEMQSARAEGLSLGSAVNSQNAPVLGFLNNLFGIQKAHAVLGVGDIISVEQFNWTTFTDDLKKFAEDIALQILKNTLMTLIQRKVLTWIQGSGAPRFVTNWAGTFVNAYTQTALSAIDNYMNNNCAIFPGFAPQLRLQLGVFYKPDNPVCSNLLQSSLGSYNFTQFYQNFNNGGWLAYGASMLPSGNYYGGLAFSAQAVDMTASQAQQTKQVQVTANQGLTGDQLCSDGSNPDGMQAFCTDGQGHDTPNYSLVPSCPSGQTLVSKSLGGTCANGAQPKQTTPGVFTGSLFAVAADTSPKEVAAASTITGLLNAVLGSLINSLAQTAITAASNGVNSALNSGVSGISSNSIQGGGSTSDIPVIPLACSPSSQAASTSVSVLLGASGGANDASGNSPTYYWLSSDGASSTGPIYSESFPYPGAYFVTLTDSNDYASSTCEVIVQ